MRSLSFALGCLAMSAPANAQSALADGFAGALVGCEEWVLNPASWSDGIEQFVSKVGLGDSMGLVESVNEAALPPKELRAANHYWRINSTASAGYILVVSDQLPMCHITGGGGSDLQPVVETVLKSEKFLSRWNFVEDKSRGEMISSQFQSREEPAFKLIVSRAKKPNQRLDRVQVLASAIYEMGN